MGEQQDQPSRVGGRDITVRPMRINTSLGLLALAALLACDEGIGPGFDGNITGQPETVVYTESLDIQLSDYTRTTSGLYMRDVVVGRGIQPPRA